MAILTQKNISLSEAGKADEVMLELADITGMPLANIVGILVESPSPR
jgi:hypothetical protein